MSRKYLVITPRDFESTLSSLLDQKRSRGYEVMVKHVEDFVGGTGRPEQMRHFVRNFAPACLLLVGDYDRVPGYPMPGTHANPPKPYLSDTYFGTGDAEVVPTLPTGRLSVTSGTELERICARLLAYPEDTGRAWRRRVILAGFLPWEQESQDPENPGWGFILENNGYFGPERWFPLFEQQTAILLGGIPACSSCQFNRRQHHGICLIRRFSA